MALDDNQQMILTVVGLIPRGRVATYGQIARLAGLPKNWRQVGAVLRDLPPGEDIPWFRVVNSRGEISGRGRPETEDFQREQLEDEGIKFDKRGRIDLDEYAWQSDA
ncbi:MAG: MGMT family protein [Pirellulaceae bacterium]